MSKSDVCAKHDGIKTIEKLRYGRQLKLYLIPCSKCGDTIERKQYKSEATYLCDYCKLNLENKLKAAEQSNLTDVKSKKEKAFDKAVGNIKSQVTNFSLYTEAIKKAEKRAESFGSIPEAMVAIELVKLGHKVIPQQKVNKYKVDFALPDLKLVIEVDGEIYHRKSKNSDREAIIQLTLGLDWKIAHVPAELIRNDITKMNKIIELTFCNTREKKQ